MSRIELHGQGKASTTFLAAQLFFYLIHLHQIYLELDLIVCFGCLDIRNEYFTISRKKISAQLTGKIKLNFIDLKQLRLDGPNLKLKQL